MGFWAQLCTYVLTLLELGTIPSSPPSPFNELQFDLTDVYAPEIFNPTIPNTLKADNAYNSIFTTDNTCNGPQSRDQWCDGRTIHTDYEKIPLTPHTGKTNYVTLELTSGRKFCGDGFCRQSTMLINGTYPGPLIRGNWGDWFEITVINKLSNCNGSSIHWHGIRQWRTVWADGVAGVTQCPIPPGESQVYRWQATQYGSSWYHSHFSLQYADGLAGPLIIDGPTSKNYDEDKGPLMLTDWYHVDAFSIYYGEVMASLPAFFTSAAKSVLLNGQGNWTTVTNGTVSPGCTKGQPNCDPAGASVYKTDISPSPNHGEKKFYKYRIINMSVSRHFSFWIDGHDFWVVATDFVPIEPIRRSFLNVAIGQRYDIIIEAKTLSNLEKRKSPNFWIKMRNCNSYCVGDPCPPNTTCSYVECRQGILSYNPLSKITPDLNSRTPKAPSTACTDPKRSSLQPIVTRNLTGQVPLHIRFPDPFEVDRRAGTQNCTEVFGRDCGMPEAEAEAGDLSDEEEDELRARGGDEPPKDGYDGHPIPPPEFGTPGDDDKPHIWDFGSSKIDPKHPNGSYQSFMIDWANYTLGLAADGIPADTWNPRFVPVVYGVANTWKVFAIAAKWIRKENHGVPVDGMVPGAAHPIHLHGHDFVVLAQSSNAFRYDGTYTLDLINPARRDVVMLPANGFVIIAFKADNPGTWLMHCHIAWHASSGLALEWVERPQDIPGLMDSVPGLREEQEAQCDRWRAHEESHCQWTPGAPAYQEDSGI